MIHWWNYVRFRQFQCLMWTLLASLQSEALVECSQPCRTIHIFSRYGNMCAWLLHDECRSIFLHSLSGCSASPQRRWECVWEVLDCWINWRNWKSYFVQSGWRLWVLKMMSVFPRSFPCFFLYPEFWMVLSPHYPLQIKSQYGREEADPKSFFFKKYIYKQFLQDSVLCTQSVTQTYCVRPLRNSTS